MIAAALALPPNLPAAGYPEPTAPLSAPLTASSTAAPAAAPASAKVAGQTLTGANVETLTSQLLGAACRRGQLEDASAAARMALPVCRSDSPQHALLLALAQAQPALMVAPEEHRLYLLRAADGVALGLLRLRADGRISQNLPGAPATTAASWMLHDGNFELCDATGRASLRCVVSGPASSSTWARQWPMARRACCKK